MYSHSGILSANKRDGGDGGIASRFHAGGNSPAAPQHGRWAICLA
jgi:hypothetical protein